MTVQLPSVQGAKNLAKRLRVRLAEKGEKIGHGKSLERVAHQYGFRDWNVMLAAIGNAPPRVWNIGDRVRGAYLSQRFEATVMDVQEVKPGWYRLGLDLDEAVDVVTFDSFSNFRKRVRGVIGPKGHSAENTSDGNPQLVIDLV